MMKSPTTTKRSQLPPGLGPWPQTYAKLLHALGRTGWICQGTVLARSLRRRRRGRLILCGPYYLWTCKLKGKTLCQALSKAQYQQLKQAIANNRRALAVLARMQNQTLKIILKKVPGVIKRKELVLPE